VLRAFSHQHGLEITVLTRETSVAVDLPTSHSHNRTHHGQQNGHIHISKFIHVTTSFSETEVKAHLEGQDTVICILTGSDIHLTPLLITAASSYGVKLFIPSEYGLDTSNSKVRELLPPYQTRHKIQGLLKKSGLSWKAIYSGLMLEDALKTDGVLGIDALWASVVVFPNAETTSVAISTYADAARAIVGVGMAGEGDPGTGNAAYISSFKVGLEELVGVVEEELDRKLDRYEGDLEGAKKEASERFKRGFFDGGVALMGRVAAWDRNVAAWYGWKYGSKNNEGWQGEVKKVVRLVRSGKIGGAGCGC
jgi:hypothetical protein